MSGPWPQRPEQAFVRNPHKMRLGQPMHIFTKLEGEWVCSVCWPERFEPIFGAVQPLRKVAR